MKPDILISTRRKGSFFRYLKKLGFKKLIVLPHFISLSSKNLSCPTPFFRGKKHFSDIHLKLVRAIDAKHYDTNIAKINSDKIKDYLPKDRSLMDKFYKSVDFPYKKIIGINAFSTHSTSKANNFFLKSWLDLAFELGRTYSEFLFILLNFKQNPIQFQLNESQNVRTFINDDSIASLTSMSLSLDYFISVDTSNVHLCKLLQVPSLIFIDASICYRMGGGGCEFIDNFVVKAGWQKNYQKTLQDFTQMSKERLDKLKG
ncbi:hypothetical protein [Campylobacter troglodytis]|uniref:hypothetical protein n=1 Tax=Campylobacter troglodytis TaxID=654363 RepID=UPI00115A4A43|nr:hypothetical protein [Campylobacter troglodytis]TQR60275.1 hypothetical protein DMC01_06450 [Campylobacter troglodytis]